MIDKMAIYTDKGLDTGWAWVVLVANFFTSFITGAFLLTSGIIQITLLEKYGEGVAKTSWVGSLFTALLSLAGPIGALIADRTSCRTAVMIGGSLMAAGCLITAFAPNIETCIFSYGFLSGFGGGVVYCVVFSVCGFNFKRRLNLAQGVTLAGAGCGLFVIAPIMEASKAEFGYTGFFIILSGISLQIVVFGALIRPSALEIKIKYVRRADKSRANDKNSNFLNAIKTYCKLLLNKYVLCLSFSMLMFCGGIYTVFLHWPNFCLHKGFSPMEGSYILSLVGIISIFGRASTGIIASLESVDERLVYSGSLAILSISLVFFQFYSSTYTGHIVNAVIVGILNGSCYVVLSTINAKYVGVEYLAAVIGIEFWFGGVGSIVVPILSGYMLQARWTYEQIFMAAGFCIFFSSLLGLGTFIIKTTSDNSMSLKEQQTREIIISQEKTAFITNDLKDHKLNIDAASNQAEAMENDIRFHKEVSNIS